MLRLLTLVITIISLLLSLTSCSKTISMKAAIVYKIGGVQPVARVPFYLLDDDLENILRKAGIYSSSSNIDLVEAYGSNMSSHDGMQSPAGVEMQAAILPHIVKSATTDFDGTARFEGLRAGTYYLVGVAQTRGGFAVWNLKVETGSGTIILDQNNAAYIE